MKTPYDPKLRNFAAEEFKAICAKYNIAGVCLFVSETHSEYVTEITPTWSVIKREGPGVFRFRSKRVDFPSKEAQHAATEASAHIVTSIINWTGQTNEAFFDLLAQLRKHMVVAYSVWGEPDSTPGDGK